jgi:hypothetical protein
MDLNRKSDVGELNSVAALRLWVVQVTECGTSLA